MPENQYSEAYKRVVVLLLTAAYAFNAMDRSIISIIGQAMKLDLKLTDTQLGLLSGTAFALLYGFGGIPIARLAERINRVNIITAALVVWSALSSLCGAAMNFSQLLLIRVGVGVAEAGCSPPAHSLISDYFEPSRRTSALSVYSSGISLGYLLAAVGGGYVGQHWGWRAACATVGLPGVIMAILIKTLLREPPRGHSETARGSRRGPSLAPCSIESEFREMRAVAKALLVDRPVLHMVLGVTIGAFAVGLGIVAGGFVADALARSDARWYALVPAIGGSIALPLYLLAAVQADWRVATGILSMAGFFQYASLGPTFGVVQNVVDQRQRATATALLYICLSVFALGGGPLFTGWMIDRFAEGHFHAFAINCPGGAASAAASAASRSACSSALVDATRQGIQVTLLFFGWASIHYLLAAAGIAKSLKAAAVRNAAAALPL